MTDKYSPGTVRFCLIAMLIGMALIACSEREDIAISTVFSSNHCDTAKPSFVQINNYTVLKDTINKSTKHLLMEKPMNIPEVNFFDNIVLYIGLGDKNQAGHNIEVKMDHAVRKGENLYLPVKVITPDKNKSHAQMMSCPCKIVSISKGNYKKIIINKEFQLEIN